MIGALPLVVLVLLLVGALQPLGSDAAPTLVWKYATGSSVQASPASIEGNIYVGSNDGYLYCLNAETGALVWRMNSGGAISSRPAFYQGALSSPGTNSATQTVMFGNADNKFYALDAATGVLRWSYAVGDKIQSSPTVHDGLQLVFFGTDNYYVYALNITEGGTLAWRKNTPSTNGNNHVRGTPVLDGDTLFVKTHYDLFSIVASSGVENWRLSEGSDSRLHSHDDPHYTPAILNATIYWGGRSGVFGVAKSTGAPYQFTGNPQASDECGSPLLHYVSSRAQTMLFVGSSGSGGINAYGLSGGTNRIWSKTACGSNSAINAPPAASRRYLYLGSSNSYLCALALDTGVTAWTFPVGGSIKTQPLLFKNKIYFGADDNYVYAITADEESQTFTETPSRSDDVASASGTGSFSGGDASRSNTLGTPSTRSLESISESHSKTIRSISNSDITTPSLTTSLSLPFLPTPSTITGTRPSFSSSLTTLLSSTRQRTYSVSQKSHSSTPSPSTSRTQSTASTSFSSSSFRSNTRTMSASLSNSQSPPATRSYSVDASSSTTWQCSLSRASLSVSSVASTSLTNSTLLTSGSSSLTASHSTSSTASNIATVSRNVSTTRGTATKSSECGSVLAWAAAADPPTANPPLLSLVRFHPHAPVVPVDSVTSALAMPELSEQRTQPPILYNITVGIVLPFNITSVARHAGRNASNITFAAQPFAHQEPDDDDDVTRSRTSTYNDGDDVVMHHTLVYVSFMLAPTNVDRTINPSNEESGSDATDNSTVGSDTDSWVDFIVNATCGDIPRDADDDVDQMAVHWVYRVLITDPPADPLPNFTASIPKIVLTIGGITSTIMSNPSGGTTLSKIAAAERAAECRELEPSSDEAGLAGVTVGDDGFGAFRGSVVEALLLCVICLALWYVMVAILRFVVYPYRTVSRIQAVLHWPSVTVMPAATQLQPAILSALSIALTTGAAVDVVLISIAVFAWLLYLLWWWGALYVREFPCELVTRGSVEDTNSMAVHTDVKQRLATKDASTSDRAFMSFIEGTVHWHVKSQFARGGGMDWKLCYYFLFKDFRNRWYALLDAALTTVVVIVAGIPLSSKGLCNFQLAVIAFAYAVLVVALVSTRAALGGLDMAFHLLVNLCGLVSSAALLLWSNLGHEYLQETFRVASSISIGAILIHSAMDLILLFMALPHVHRQLRMSAAASELDAALLPSPEVDCLQDLVEGNGNGTSHGLVVEDDGPMYEEMLEVNLEEDCENSDDDGDEVVVLLPDHDDVEEDDGFVDPVSTVAMEDPIEEADDAGTRDLGHTELARLEEMRKARDILTEFYQN